MIVIPLLIVLLCVFAGLVFFIRHILGRHISRATGHLQELSREYAIKQEEANKRLQQAKEESEKLLLASKQQAEQIKEKILREAEEMKSKILEEAKQTKKEIVEKAQRNYEFLKNELEQKIEEKAKEKACQLIGGALPEAILRDIHQRLMQESTQKEFQLGRLNIPEDISEVKVISAFALTDSQRQDLMVRLKKQMTNNFSLVEELDSSLMAGFIIGIGHIVIDASLKNRIQNVARNI